MHLAYLLATVLAGTVASQSAVPAFESQHFNVTDSLLKLGVNTAGIPALAGFDTSVTENATSMRRSERSQSLACIAACTSLRLLYRNNVYYQGESLYKSFTGSYWSDAQQDVSPACVFKPTQADEVSVVVLLSRLTQCPFAAKSGGHAAMAGASSIEDGITISFANMKAITLNRDKSAVDIQPGNVWGDVYRNLGKSEKTVIGGRLYNIGVGGLTTGGGISYFSARYGWACDNVESYDVITASGIMVRATAKQYPDLYWALRGGGNNFGLVVNFRLKTIPLPKGQIWGGQNMYLEDQFDGLDKAFTYVTANSAKDIDASLYLVYVYSQGTKLGLPVRYHADTIKGPTSPLWAGFKNITATSDTTKVRNLADWAAETMNDSPNGLRELFYTLSTVADITMATFARRYFFDTVSRIADVPGIVPNIVFQGIGAPQLQQMKKNGGNALGFAEASKGKPAFIMLIAASWTDKKDDARVAAYCSDVLKAIKAEAVRRSLFLDYTYMNYASEYQDVIKSYGGVNKAKLKDVAMKYDPAQVFQKLQPGYFKLTHAPTPNTNLYNI